MSPHPTPEPLWPGVSPFLGAVMRLRRLPYAHQQALAFVGALAFFGGLAGALWAAAKGGLR